jgi:hypothetical protein
LGKMARKLICTVSIFSSVVSILYKNKNRR